MSAQNVVNSSTFESEVTGAVSDAIISATSRCLINSDLCRNIASYCNHVDLLRLEQVSRQWQETVLSEFHEMRRLEKNHHLIFKSFPKYDSDKKICCHLQNSRAKERCEVFMLGGALHSNCKITYMFVDRPVTEQHLYGGDYRDVYGHIIASTSTTDNAGHVIVMGGWNTSQDVVCPLVMSFDLNSKLLDTTVLPDLPQSRCFGAAECTIQGDLLHLGGGNSPFSAAQSFADCVIRKYDADHWHEGVVPNMHQERCGHRAVTLLNDSILVAGGYAGNDTFLSSVELLDSQLDRWTQLPDMSISRSGAASVLGPGGAVYMAGGTMNTTEGLRSMERYDPREGKWQSLADMNLCRSFVAGCQSVHNGFYVMGGMHQARVADSVEFYDFRANKWNFAVGSAEAAFFALNKVTAYMALRF